MTPAPPPVLIAGAGPVGLITAVALQRHGVPVQVLERRLGRPHASRASTFQPPVLDRLAQLGLLDRLEPRGLRVERLRNWDLDQARWQDLDFALLAGRTDHPYRLHLEQGHLVEALEQVLRQATQPCLQQGVEVIGCEPGRWQRGRLQLRDRHGETRWIEGSWLVAADGARSSMRQAAGLAFPGEDEICPVVRLFLPRLPAALEQALPPLTYVRGGERSISLLRMAQGWRLILRPRPDELEQALAVGEPGVPGSPASDWSRRMLQTVLETLLAQLGAAATEPVLAAAEPILQDHYGVGRRCTPTHRFGRLLLIGDAAHITNTRGGLNMNFGLLEGLALADALAAWWHGDRRREAPLDAWARLWQERTAAVLLPLSARLLGPATLPDPHLQPGRNEADAAAASDAAARQRLLSATLLDLEGTPT